MKYDNGENFLREINKIFLKYNIDYTAFDLIRLTRNYLKYIRSVEIKKQAEIATQKNIEAVALSKRDKKKNCEECDTVFEYGNKNCRFCSTICCRQNWVKRKKIKTTV